MSKNVMILAIPRRARSRTRGLGEIDPSTLPTHDQCTGGPPIPIECFSPQGAAWTQAQTYARQSAAWNAGVDSSYQTALDNWKLNDGKRWVNGEFVKTAEPPPPPPVRSTDPKVWYDILTNPDSAYNSNPAYGELANMPAYMGGGITTVNGPNRILLPQSGQGPADLGTRAAPAYYAQQTQRTSSTSSTPQRTSSTPQRTSSTSSTPQQTSSTSPTLPTSVQEIPSWVQDQPWYVAAGIGLLALLAFKGLSK